MGTDSEIYIMDVKQAVSIIIIVRIILLGLTSIAACLYAIPLCFIRRFHTPLNLLTLNVCIAASICSTYWTIFYIMDTYYPHILWTSQSCKLILYLNHMVNSQELYAVCLISLNRLFTMVYKNKALFRTKNWVAVCVSAQWILGASISLPILATNIDYCLILRLEFKSRIYVLFSVLIIPAICLAITNSIIFIYAHRSTRRVQAANRESAQASTLRHRDARLLKHMIFLFAVDFCGWAPIYIIQIINWNAVAVSPIVAQVFFTVPVASFFIDVADLFLYNHELRRYFTNKWRITRTIRRRE